MDIDQVLRAYPNSDADKRIILFLAYRDLREQFIDSERDPAADLFPDHVDTRRIPMKMSSLSMLVFAAYLFCFGLIFVFIPNPVIGFFGVPPTSEVWIRILGYILASLGFYYFRAVRENDKSFYRWSVYGRLPILPTFAGFVFAGIGPKIILLFGVFDLGCALWTWFALKNESRDSQTSCSPGIMRA